MGLAEDLAEEREGFIAASAARHQEILDRNIAENPKVIPTEPIPAAIEASQKPGVDNREAYCATCDTERPFYSIEPADDARDGRLYNCKYCDTTQTLKRAG